VVSRRPTETFPRYGVTSPSESPPRWLVGPYWGEQGLRQPGWLLLPLRGFLAVTFIYAGLQKLANPAYLDPHNRSSVLSQMQALQNSSPIGPLLGLSAHAPTLVGLLIAFGELAVGMGALLGLWTRLAAVGGAFLSLTFFLTVSWNTAPYYYGSDIVFLFAWLVMAGFGAGAVLSVDGWLDTKARRQMRLPPTPAVVAVAVPHLRQLCGASICGLGPSGECGRQSRCPVFPVSEELSPPLRAELDRRTLLLGARTAGIVAAAAAVGGGLTALIGRLVGGTENQAQSSLLTRHPTPNGNTKAGAGTKSGSPHAGSPMPGTAIGQASAVPVGQAAQFTDPASGAPAWLVHPAAGTFVAFSAVCTHAGCTVAFDSASLEFICPCHGGTYDAKTGQVLAGPPPSPLPSIPVRVINGQIRVD
jgi:thiosulfate dehydrogenase [quinone] large subunit